MQELLERIRSGDRSAAADFVASQAPFIRRRYRQRLNHAMRRLCDSQDLVATILRRLDRMVSRGAVSAASEAELWSLIFRIADHAVIDKSRILKKTNRLVGEDSLLAYEIRCSMARANRLGHRNGISNADDVELARMIRGVPAEVDREILTLWLLDNDLRVIADEIGMEPAAVRKRWQRLREALRKQIAETGAKGQR
ncbi:MAG TPA: hypothetical protein VF777_10330 [Phycisphaerales bacterium]